MSNQNYSAFKTRKANAPHGTPPKLKKGAPGAEHDGAQKDSTATWPGAPGPTRPNFNKTGVPQVKTVVVSDGVLAGGQDHFTK
jgi:hypothetical protein